MVEDYEGLVFEEASTKDLVSVAAIHESALSVGVLSNCGTAFLVRMYAAILKSPMNSIIVARIRNNVVGFIVGTREEVNPFRALDLVSLLIFLFNCMRKPYLILTSLTVLREVNRERSRPGDMEISHLAVSDEFREMGIGSRLISVVEMKALSQGLSSVFTRTHNERLVKFYKCKFDATEDSRFSTSKIDYVTLKWQVNGDRR